MIFENINFVDEKFQFFRGTIETCGEKIIKITKKGAAEKGLLTALPGFIDIHTHGIMGADTCDGKEASLALLSESYAKHGVTSFCPTTMTFPVELLAKIFAEIEKYKGREQGAYIQGINMEGPYISTEKCGAQNTSYIKNPKYEEFEYLNSISQIKLIDLAPEKEGALPFAKKVKSKAVCSVAHTSATFEQATSAFKNSFSHVTHLFNAMTPFSHREPGAVGAAFADRTATCELICDGFHLAPETVKLAFKILGEDRCVCISDSLSCADMKDGKYSLGGQTVIMQDGKAHLENGTIAGSSTNLFDEFKNLLCFGIPLKAALKSVTINPAKVLKADSFCGSLTEGKNADIIFVDEALNLKNVVIKGRKIF